MPRSPFAADLAASAWTGEQMLVVDPGTGRAATYDPRARRWERQPSAPRSFHPLSPFVWTGSELVILDAAEGAAAGLAYDPVQRAWRMLAAPPLAHITTAVWAGDRVVAASPDRHAAAYLPAADCWGPLADIPGAELVRGLHRGGEQVFAVTQWQSLEPAVVARLDVEAGTWIEAAAGPLASIWSDGIWAGDRLVFISPGDNEPGRIRKAAYDPTSDSWETLDADCRLRTRDAVWTGRLLVDGFEGRAVDPVTWQCYRLPRSSRVDRSWFGRERSWFARIWTGRELIHWSGSPGAGVRPRPDGVSYRPPSAFVDESRVVRP